MKEYKTKIQLKQIIDNINYGDQCFMISPYNLNNKKLHDNYYNQMETKLDRNKIVYMIYKRDGKYRVKGYHQPKGYLKEVETTLDEIYWHFNMHMTDIFGE